MGREINHSPPCSIKAKNEWIYYLLTVYALTPLDWVTSHLFFSNGKLDVWNMPKCNYIFAHS